MAEGGCPRHANLPAIGRCARCGNAYCRECRVEEIVTELEFCSEGCREEAAGVPGPSIVDDEDFARAKKGAISEGWSLWARSIPSLAAHAFPVALGLALVFWAAGSSMATILDEQAPPMPPAAGAAAWLLGGFGIAIVGVVLSSRYTGFDPGNPYVWALRRLVPWALAWALVMAGSMVGFLLLIVPGIIVGTRLLWADEFALVHSATPVAALRQSWDLTRGKAGAVFVFQFVLGLANYLVFIPAFLIFFGVEYVMISTGMNAGAAGQIVESTLAFLIFFVTYGAAHAPELAYFYGLRAEQNLAG